MFFLKQHPEPPEKNNERDRQKKPGGVHVKQAENHVSKET